MLRRIAMLAVCLAACSPNTGSSASPTTSPAPAASGASAAVEFPLIKADFSCTLPVQVGGENGKLGFLHLPDGIFTEDSRTSTIVVSPQTLDANRATVAQPVLVGAGVGMFYDRLVSRWLPVSRNAVAPDGSSYAYLYAPSSLATWELRIVDVRSARERSIDVKGLAVGKWQPVLLDYRTEGIYLAAGLEGPMTGLWLADPVGLTYHRIATVTGVKLIADGGAWLDSILKPSNAHSMGFSDSVQWLDLATGGIKTWFFRDGGVASYLIGPAPDGGILVAVWPQDSSSKTSELWHVTAPGSEKLIYRGSTALGGFNVVTDSHGAWLLGNDGLYLYRAGSVSRVAAAAGTAPLGSCV